MRVLPLACVGLAMACSTNNGPSAPTNGQQQGPSGIVAGDESTCLLAQGGAAYCWGTDTAGALGNGVSLGVELTPVAVTGNHTYTALSGAEFFRCGLSGELPLCWGQTLIGGTNGNLYTDSVPTSVTSDLPPLATIATGPSHACGLTKAGIAYCWGENYFGQLGIGDTLRHHSAVAVAGGMRWTAISVGFWHTCALTADSTTFCWGENLVGELAASPDSLPLSTTPLAIAGAPKFASLSAGSLYTCGVTGAGALYCWGWNYAGNLGDSTTSNTEIPTPVGQPNLVFRSVVASSANSIALTTCGITTANAVYCWGWGGYGQIGNPSAPIVSCDSITTNPAPCSSLVPFPLAGGLEFATVSIGTTHACGVTLSSTAYCWGTNDHGQLGDGTTQSSTTPIAVSGSLVAKEHVTATAQQRRTVIPIASR
jgi:alpha-tubulin suppressor-like RCC1 family protein